MKIDEYAPGRKTDQQRNRELLEGCRPQDEGPDHSSDKIGSSAVSEVFNVRMNT